MFLVKQPTKTRPIFNLKSLNQFIRKDKFKLEGLDQVKTMIQPNDYFMKLDLTDAYYSLPITSNQRKYLRFQLANKLFEYQCLPFGFTNLLQSEWQNILTLTKQTLQELELWSSTQLLLHNQMLLILPPFDMTIWMDASKKGWGKNLDRKSHCPVTSYS